MPAGFGEQERKLYDRDGGALGLVVDRDGVVLGPDCPLVERRQDGSQAIDVPTTSRLLRDVFAYDGDPRPFVGLCRSIGTALEKGGLLRAQLLGLQMPIGPLEPHHLARLRYLAPMVKAGFNPEQPRRQNGEWGEAAGAAGPTALSANGGDWGGEVDKVPPSNQKSDSLSSDPTGHENPPSNQTPSHTVAYPPRAGEPPDQATQSAMQCMADCLGMDLTVTGAREGGHAPGSAHETGQAADLGERSNPGLRDRRPEVEQCYSSCFASDSSMAQHEQQPPHFHFQTRPGRGDAIGFLPGEH